MKPSGDKPDLTVEGKRYKIVVAYDGARYQGWQRQRIGLGVQQLVEEALQKLNPAIPYIHGASRTDAGVHAREMVAHLDAPANWRMPARKLPLAVNAFLPPDIRVIRASRVPETFHARFLASGKEYRYFVRNHPAHDPLFQHMEWHVPRKLSLEAMRDGARRLEGKKNFKAFAANRGYEMASYVRTLYRCAISKSGSRVTFRLHGDGFLYKMCRGIVGTLVQVGYGRLQPEDIDGILESRTRISAGMNAPPQGLILWKVFYDGAPAENASQPREEDADE